MKKVEAYLFTNVQSGDVESSCDPDFKEDEREMWHRAPLVKMAMAEQPAPTVQEVVGYFYLDDGQWKQASDPVSFLAVLSSTKTHPQHSVSGSG
jgi:hypothetical protein